MSKKAAIGRALLKLLKWAGVTLAREGVDLIVEKTTTKQPDDTLRINPAADQFVLPGTLRRRMMTHPDELREIIRREREKQL